MAARAKKKRIFAYDNDASYIYEEWTRTDYSATGAEKTAYLNLWGLMIYQGKKIRFAMGTPLTNERVYWEVSDSEFSKAFEESIPYIIEAGSASSLMASSVRSKASPSTGVINTNRTASRSRMSISPLPERAIFPIKSTADTRSPLTPLRKRTPIIGKRVSPPILKTRVRPFGPYQAATAK